MNCFQNRNWHIFCVHCDYFSWISLLVMGTMLYKIIVSFYKSYFLFVFDGVFWMYMLGFSFKNPTPLFYPCSPTSKTVDFNAAKYEDYYVVMPKDWGSEASLSCWRIALFNSYIIVSCILHLIYITTRWL